MPVACNHISCGFRRSRRHQEIPAPLYAAVSAFFAIFLLSNDCDASLYQQGRALYNKKKYDQAKEILLQAAEKEGSGNALYFIGEIEKAKGNIRDAEGYYRAAIDKKSIDRQYLVNAYWNALLIAEQRNDYEAVADTCRAMWKRTGDEGAKRKIESIINKFLWSDNADAVQQYHEGIEAKSRGPVAEAQKKFRNALSLDPSFLAPRFELGMAAYSQGDSDQAAGYLEEVANRIPFYADVNLVMGDIYFARRAYRQAIPYFDRYLRFGFLTLDADCRARLKRATCSYHVGEYDSAETDIKRVLAHDPASLDTLLLWSALKVKINRESEAIGILERAQAKHPDSPEVVYQMGSIYYRMGNEDFIRCFERLFSMESQKKEIPSRYQKAFFILAKNRYEKGNYDQAIAVLKTIDEKSRTFEVRLLAGKALMQLKRYDEAIIELESISPKGEDRYLLCRAYAMSGRREKAKELLSELSALGDYLTRAKSDPALADIARELGESSGRKD